MHEDEEILDLVNAHDTVIGTIQRAEMARAGYASPKGYVRFVEGFIITDTHEVWVPVRGMHKVIAPGTCDFSVAEHVLSGESYEQAIQRAFSEEAGLAARSSALIPLGKLPPNTTKPWFDVVFALKVPTGTVPHYSPQEFSSASWMPAQTLEPLLLDTPNIKPTLLPALKLLKTLLVN